MNIQEYVVENVDKAVENGWLKVYYQPVIRSLTGALCGAESLVRWIDPEVGFLMPAVFIEALEKSHQIYKLDCYMLEKVCSDIHKRMSEGLPTVPVSINFSRVDFVECDMLGKVEELVDRYDIPRDYLHIEITESMIVSDEKLMSDVISRFRERGYEVWMDDFGSGYSSLTMLKDYEFDQLKLDMDFLTSFTEKSKNILRAILIMAKDLGIKTLAEGVETEDELEYLKEIGCGKIQGFYYGKPEPLEDMFAHLEEKDIYVESRSERQFYEAACIHIRPTDAPLEIIEDDGQNIRTLFMNDAYKAQIFSDNPSLEEADRRIYHTPSPLLHAYREFANLLEKTRKEETFYYTASGNYIMFRAQVIAEYDGRFLIKGTISNITADQENDKTEALDNKLRGLNHLFEVVHLMDLKEDTLIPLLGRYKYSSSHISKGMTLRQRMELFANERIFSADRIRFAEFIDLETLHDRIAASEGGFISGIFGVKQEDGAYRAEELLVMSIPGSAASEFLFCIKPYTEPVFDEKVFVTGEDEMKEYSLIVQTAIWNAHLRFFWKDMDRKFGGASRAFMDYFGIRSMGDLLGRKMEEMEWYVENKPIREAEKRLLKDGTPISRLCVSCITGGVYRDVLISEIPIYDNGVICGLMGYVESAEEEEMPVRLASGQRRLMMDAVTGLMDAHGFMDALIDCSLHYHESGQDYGLVLFTNENHYRIIDTYGSDFSDQVLRKMSEVLLDITGGSSSLSRPRESVFALLAYVDDLEILKARETEIREALNAIASVDGKPVTIRMKSSASLRSVESCSDESLYALTLSKLGE